MLHAAFLLSGQPPDVPARLAAGTYLLTAHVQAQDGGMRVTLVSNTATLRVP